jgi:hypothetical protein
MLQSEMEELAGLVLGQTQDVQAGAHVFGNKAHETEGDVLMMGYPVWGENTNTNKKEGSSNKIMRELEEAPPTRKLTKAGEKATFNAAVTISARIINMNPVVGSFEPLPDGSGYRINCLVKYDGRSGKDVKMWLQAQAKAIHAGELKDISPFDLTQFVAPDGTPASKAWIEVRKESVLKVDLPDSEGPPIRAPASSYGVAPPLMTYLMPVTVIGVRGELWVTLQMQEDKTYVPLIYTSLKTRGVKLEASVAGLSLSERFRRFTTNDMHICAPISGVRSAIEAMPSSIALYVRHLYQTRPPAPRGVTIICQPCTGDSNFMYMPKEQAGQPGIVTQLSASASLTFDISMMQWYGSFSRTQATIYFLHFAADRKSNAWLGFGITDMETFAKIMTATRSLKDPEHRERGLVPNVIPFYVSASLSRPKGPVPPSIDSKPAAQPGPRDGGVYTYFVSHVAPDYLAMFLEKKMHRISEERYLREFAGFEKFAPLPEKLKDFSQVPKRNEPAPDVISVGNNVLERSSELTARYVVPRPEINKTEKPIPHNHVFKGRISALCGREFAVLTNRIMTDEDLQACQDPVRGDALLDEWNAVPGFKYWIFALDKVALETRRSQTPVAIPVPVPVPAPIVPSVEKPVEAEQKALVPKKPTKRPAKPASDDEGEEEVTTKKTKPTSDDEEDTKPKPKKKETKEKEKTKEKVSKKRAKDSDDDEPPSDVEEKTEVEPKKGKKKANK